jgi:hypothetical protein
MTVCCRHQPATYWYTGRLYKSTSPDPPGFPTDGAMLAACCFLQRNIFPNLLLCCAAVLSTQYHAKKGWTVDGWTTRPRRVLAGTSTGHPTCRECVLLWCHLSGIVCVLCGVMMS